MKIFTLVFSYIGSSSERRDSRSSKSRNDNVRYPDRPITPIPASRRDSFRRSRSPVRRDHSPTQNGGSPVPPHREGKFHDTCRS